MLKASEIIKSKQIKILNKLNNLISFFAIKFDDFVSKSSKNYLYFDKRKYIIFFLFLSLKEAEEVKEKTRGC